MAYEDEEDPEAGSTPKMNKFTHEISDWLMLGTIGFLIVYGILYLFYEIALGMAHIRWVYNSFLLICTVDIIAYFITRFAVLGDVNRCLLYMSLITFTCNFLINLVAPALVLVSYELTLEHPSTGGVIEDAVAVTENHEKHEYIFGDQPVQDCALDSSGFKCGVVRSIRTSIWCMLVLIAPRPLVIYSLISVLRHKPFRYR